MFTEAGHLENFSHLFSL